MDKMEGGYDRYNGLEDNVCKHCMNERKKGKRYIVAILGCFLLLSILTVIVTACMSHFSALHAVKERLNEHTESKSADIEDLQKRVAKLEQMQVSDCSLLTLKLNYFDKKFKRYEISQKRVFKELQRRETIVEQQLNDLGNAMKHTQIESAVEKAITSKGNTQFDTLINRIKRDGNTSESNNSNDRKQRRQRNKDKKKKSKKKKNKNKKNLQAIQFEGSGAYRKSTDKSNLTNLWKYSLSTGEGSIFKYLDIQATGRVEVLEKGVYLLYAQMSLTGTRRHGYHIIEIQESKSEHVIATCKIVQVPGTEAKETCFTMKLVEIERGTEIFIRELEENSGVHFLEDSTYFGLIKIGTRSTF